jgi:uncharacterized protein (DUF433 family)
MYRRSVFRWYGGDANSRLPLQKLAAGETGEEILAAFPQLKPVHIQACLEYAARLAAEEIVLANQ